MRAAARVDLLVANPGLIVSHIYMHIKLRTPSRKRGRRRRAVAVGRIRRIHRHRNRVSGIHRRLAFRQIRRIRRVLCRILHGRIQIVWPGEQPASPAAPPPDLHPPESVAVHPHPPGGPWSPTGPAGPVGRHLALIDSGGKYASFRLRCLVHLKFLL